MDDDDEQSYDNLQKLLEEADDIVLDILPQDLVKSHLMYAVREEVEVLKEKIAELMDRINLLEAENAILKAHASPDTLAQLSQVTTKLSINSTGSGQ